MVRKSPRCPAGCAHAADSHVPSDSYWATEYGCLYCDCRWQTEPPPAPPPLRLHPDACQQMLALARAVVAGIATAEAELAAVSSVHGRNGEQIRRSYVAAMDLICALGLLLRSGELGAALPRSALVGLTPEDLEPRIRQAAYEKGWL